MWKSVYLHQYVVYADDTLVEDIHNSSSVKHQYYYYYCYCLSAASLCLPSRAGMHGTYVLAKLSSEYTEVKFFTIWLCVFTGKHVTQVANIRILSSYI